MGEQNKYPGMSDEKPSEMGRLEECVVRELCQDYARMTRVNISEEHGQIVTQIAAIEEQISTFSDLLTQIENNNTILRDVFPKISAQFDSLKPHFPKIDRLEDLMTRVNSDFEAIEKQLEVAEGTVVEEGTLKTVLKMPLNLFNKQTMMEGSQSSAVTPLSSQSAFSPHPIFKTEAVF